jgi:hypothetical protein
MEETGHAYNISVWKSDGKRPIDSPRHTREDNIKVELKDIGTRLSDLSGSAGSWEHGSFRFYRRHILQLCNPHKASCFTGFEAEAHLNNI